MSNGKPGTGRILLTGGTGFVGGFVRDVFDEAGLDVCLAVRQAPETLLPRETSVTIGDIGAETDWSTHLDGIGAVVHLAGRVHQMPDHSPDPLVAHRAVNRDGTRRLAEAAESAGVSRFVLMSTVFVHHLPLGDLHVTEATQLRPLTPYGQSKLEAEAAVQEVCHDGVMDFTIIRSPLVYGPGVRGNVARLLGLVYRALPLPIGSIRNSRSMISVQNLSDLVLATLLSERAIGQIFLASDGEDLATVDMMRRLAHQLGRPDRSWRFPPSLLAVAATCLGQGETYGKMFGTLTVDSSQARELLDWKPRLSVDEGLKIMAEWYGKTRG